MICLAIDPGIRGAGVCLGTETELLAAAYVKNPADKGAGPAECRSMALAVYRWAEAQLVSPGWAGDQGLSLREVTRVVVEWPRFRTISKQRGDQNDLAPLIGVDCALATLYLSAQVEGVYPEVWKGGSVDTIKVIWPRVLRRLTGVEKTRVKRPGKQKLLDPVGENSIFHNVVDAAAVYLWATGRFERIRIIEP